MYALWQVNSYNVSVSAGSNGTVNKTSFTINYAGTNTFTVTPKSGYYLNSISCTNGYTVSGFSTGLSATGIQTITVKNNSKTTGSTCSISYGIACPYAVGKTWEFNYTGGAQSFTVPCNGSYKIDVYGAEGGLGYYRADGDWDDSWGKKYSVPGGKGSYATGILSTTKNTNLYVVIGGAGGAGPGGAGGYNGGGKGRANVFTSDLISDTGGGGGGGSTDVRISSNTISNRIIVAGGGAGASVYEHQRSATFTWNQVGYGTTSLTELSNGTLLQGSEGDWSTATEKGEIWYIKFWMTGGGGGGWYGGHVPGSENGNHKAQTAYAGTSNYNSSYISSFSSTANNRSGNGYALITLRSIN